MRSDMAELPKSWGLTKKKRADGKLDIVGKNALGEEYVARTTEQDGVTERDLQILDLGNPDKRDINKFVGFYRDERKNAMNAWEHKDDGAYMEGAEQVVRAGLHLGRTKVGYTRQYAENYDRCFGK